MAQASVTLLVNVQDQATADLQKIDRELENFQRKVETTSKAVSSSTNASSEGLAKETGALKTTMGQLSETTGIMEARSSSAAKAVGQLEGSVASAGAAAAQSSTEASGAASAWAALDEANAAAAESTSASSEALYRLTGGAAGTAPALEDAAGSARELGHSLEVSEVSAGSFGDALYGIEGGFDQTRMAGQGFLQTAKDMSSEFTAAGAVLASFGGVLTAVTGSLVATGIQYNTLQQVSGRAMVTMTGSAEAAADQMARLHEFADTSPFSRATWISGQQQLMAFGMEAERVVPTLEGVQNAVAAVGGGNNEIMQLVAILGAIEGQGKITGRELQRMGQMGINAADLMGDSLGMTGNEIREQVTNGSMDALTAVTALTDGMQSRFGGAAEGLRETYEGSLDRIRARLRDLGGVLAAPLVDPNGGGFLIDAINQAADFGTALLSLPDPVLQVAGGLTAAAGGAALLGGGFLMLAPRVLETGQNMLATYNSMRDFVSGSPRMQGALRGLGVAAGVTAVSLGAMFILDQIYEKLKLTTPAIEETERAMRGLASAGNTGSGQDLISTMGQRLEALDESGSNWVNKLPGWGRAIAGGLNPSLGTSAEIARIATEEYQQVDEVLSGFVTQGSISTAAENFSALAESLDGSGYSTEDMAKRFPEATAALRALANEADLNIDTTRLWKIAQNEAALAALNAGESIDVINRSYRDSYYAAANAGDGAITLGGALRDMSEYASESASKLQEIVDSYTTLGLISVDAQTQIGNWHEALRGLNEALEENGRNLDISTEGGQAMWSQMAGLGSQAWDTATAMAEAGYSVDEVGRYLEESNSQLADSIEGMRIGSDQARTLGENFGWSSSRIRELAGGAALTATEAQQLADMLLLIPESVESEFFLKNATEDMVGTIHRDLDALPDEIEVLVRAQTDDVQQVLSALDSENHELVAHLIGNDTAAREMVAAWEDGGVEAVVRIIGDDSHAQNVVWDFANNEWAAVANIEGNITPAAEAVAAFQNGDHTTVAKIIGEDNEARATIAMLMGGYYPTTATITGDDSLARGTMAGFTNYPWSTHVTASASTGAAESALNHAARDRYSTITMTQRIIWANAAAAGHEAIVGGDPRRANGGRAPVRGFSDGGRLPETGLGTDKIMGVTGDGTPLAWLDDREWIINNRASDKYDRVLGMINRDAPEVQHLARYAEGGSPSRQASPDTVSSSAPVQVHEHTHTVEAGAVVVTVAPGPEGILTEDVLDQLRDMINEVFEDSEKRDY